MRFKDIILRVAYVVIGFLGRKDPEPQPTVREKFKRAYACVREFGPTSPDLEELVGAEVWQAAVKAVRDRKAFGRDVLPNGVFCLALDRKYGHLRSTMTEAYALRPRYHHPLAY